MRAPSLSGKKRVAASIAILVVAGVAPYRVPTWDSQILTSGPYIYADVYKDLSAKTDLDLTTANNARQMRLVRLSAFWAR